MTWHSPWSVLTTKFRKRNGSWTPRFHRPIPLISAILICWILIAVLQWLLARSQRNSGIYFAPSMNDAPLFVTFLYNYLPTLVAVIFAIFWACIDLETKRLEPYYRLSAEGDGVSGEESLLLEYSFEFLVVVPWKAIRRRHWAVVWASFAFVLISWGIVPAQAGIFSTRRVSRTFPTTFNVSTNFLSAENQVNNLTLAFAQSVYGIAALNETLPAFMTPEYMLTPFTPNTQSRPREKNSEKANWTAPTTMYSLDLTCSPAILTATQEKSSSYNSTSGCMLMVGLSSNYTIDPAPQPKDYIVKEFSAMYAAYYYSYAANYYIDTCPPGKTHTFYAAFTRNKNKETDSPSNVTAIFCEPNYYSQKVNATVDSATKRPIKVVTLGPKQPLGDNTFNATWLEMMMNGGSATTYVRGDGLPSRSIPDYVEQVADTNLTLPSVSMPMVGLAAIIGARPFAEYLDWRALSESYEKAYRLMFARVMADVLGTGFTGKKDVLIGSELAPGNSKITTDALIVEPTFAYIVEGLLGVVSLCAMALLYLATTRKMALRSDPATIASVMSLTADSEALLADMANLDCCSLKELRRAIMRKKYKLIEEDQEIRIAEVDSILDSGGSGQTNMRRDTQTTISKPVRPREFSLWMAALLIGSFAGLAIALATLFIKARPNGLSLPSNNHIVQTLLENYIPTAIATIIEPTWILINRLMCLLQPIEQLQACNAKARGSIDLNYSSLPPQLVMFKAIRARHFILAAVCAMALLANVLAVAFSGLFYQKAVESQKAETFQSPFQLRFVSINGSIGPAPQDLLSDKSGISGAYRGGTGDSQFLIAESNHTRGTPLPPWTDEKFFYLPFANLDDGETANEDLYEAETALFGAELDCRQLNSTSDYQLVLNPTGFQGHQNPILNVTIRKGAVTAACTSNSISYIQPGPPDSATSNSSCIAGTAALELVFRLYASRLNASQAEQEACSGSVVLGWVRDRIGTCDTSKEKKLDDGNSLIIQCQPTLVHGRGNVRIDSKGRLEQEGQQFSVKRGFAQEEVNRIFSNNPINLIMQSTQYLFRYAYPVTWHNDSLANDYLNYFVQRGSNSTRLLDATNNLPKLEDVQAPINRAYAGLFAIWLGANKEHLFVPATNMSTASGPGWRVVREERLFLSTTSFAIAEGILVISTLVAIMVYFRRPGEYLPRLPVNIASIIGLFAASAAAGDLQGTSQLGAKERASHLEKLDLKYGYGSYVGVDGQVHVGIERAPFVRLRRSTAAGRKRKKSMHVRRSD